MEQPLKYYLCEIDYSKKHKNLKFEAILEAPDDPKIDYLIRSYKQNIKRILPLGRGVAQRNLEDYTEETSDITEALYYLAGVTKVYRKKQPN